MVIGYYDLNQYQRLHLSFFYLRVWREKKKKSEDLDSINLLYLWLNLLPKHWIHFLPSGISPIPRLTQCLQ